MLLPLLLRTSDSLWKLEDSLNLKLLVSTKSELQKADIFPCSEFRCLDVSCCCLVDVDLRSVCDRVVDAALAKDRARYRT